MNSESLVNAIIVKTLRVPKVLGTNKGNSEQVVRQLDIALMSVGFKASSTLMEYLVPLHPVIVTEHAIDILAAVNKLVGNHVKHNAYFKEFPENVPDTILFWLALVEETYGDKFAPFFINLLELDEYGKYKHTYEEMVKAHGIFKPDASVKLTTLYLGNTLPEECWRLFNSLAESKVPASPEDLELLKTLAEVCLDDVQPVTIPVRENKAVINAVRFENDKPLLIDTATDILRLAAYLSGGDVTLEKPTKFKSFKRAERKKLLAALDPITVGKLVDVKDNIEPWKRLGKTLHAEEYPYQNAIRAFRIARNPKLAITHAAKVELAFEVGDTEQAMKLLAQKPGVFMRNLDRLLGSSISYGSQEEPYLKKVVPKVSTRVLFSVREHLYNRYTDISASTFQVELQELKKKHGVIEDAKISGISMLVDRAPRIFVNRKGRAYVTENKQKTLSRTTIERAAGVIDRELKARLKKTKQSFIVDESILSVALPVSNKQTANGFNILPRGSRQKVEPGILRFFMYWKQTHASTDYDLSAIILNENFTQTAQLSYTGLTAVGGVHSGDITSAPNGASEFIDIDLDKVQGKYIVPQVNIYSGEDFSEVEESFFGFMHRTPAQKGNPFEAATVKHKSDLRDKGKTALPVIFIKQDDGTWIAKWMHLYLKGQPSFNATENNRMSTALLVRAIAEKDYLNVQYLLDLVGYSYYKEDEDYAANTFLGLEVPEKLSENTKTITLTNLHELIP